MTRIDFTLTEKSGDTTFYKRFEWFLVNPFDKVEDKSENTSRKFKTTYFLTLAVAFVLAIGSNVVSENHFFPLSSSIFLIALISIIVFFILYIISRTSLFRSTTILYVFYSFIVNLAIFMSMNTNFYLVFIYVLTFDSVSLLYESTNNEKINILLLSVIGLIATFISIPIYRTDIPINILISITGMFIIISIITINFYLYTSKQNEMILDLNNKLETEMSIIKEANVSQSKFISNTSHEIRNQLQIIKGYLTILNENKVYDEQFLSRIETSTTNILKLLDDFLDLKLIEMGKITLNNKPENIKTKLQEIYDFFLIQFERKNLNHELVIDQTIPDSLLVDIYRLNQIIINLIQNSIKYTFQGFINVRLNLKKETKSYCTVLYEFQDSGIGIKDEEKSKIFKSFSRATNGNYTDIKGAGLGLNIASNLITTFKGNIWFESQYDKGTSFFIELTLPKNDTSPLELRK